MMRALQEGLFFPTTMTKLREINRDLKYPSYHKQKATTDVVHLQVS